MITLVIFVTHETSLVPFNINNDIASNKETVQNETQEIVQTQQFPGPFKFHGLDAEMNQDGKKSLYVAKLFHLFTCIVAGPTGYGKTMNQFNE